MLGDFIFMSSILTPEKRNVSFSQLLCIASMLEWSLYLKIALRVGSAMFSVTGSNLLYLEIFRFFTIFEKKLFRLSVVSDSVLPFSIILILSVIHITDICRKASRKIYVLARIAPHMDLPKRRMVMNAFSNSQFNYCPLMWMCHNRTTNRKINRLHERCFHIIYNDKESSFKMLLEKDSSVFIHDRNIQCLATEMYKLSNGLSPVIASNIFTQKNCHPYNLRLNSQFSRPLVRSVFHGTESISYLGPVIWDILPDSYKNLPNFRVFKNRIKNWKPENCPCRLCKTYISRIGFT